MIVVAGVFVPAGSVDLAACATSCAADPTMGSPGVIIDYREVAAAHPGLVHVRACFGTVCREGDSDQGQGPKVVIALDDKTSPATQVELTASNGSGVLLSTSRVFTVPRVSDGATCGDAKQWQLNLVVRGGTLVEVGPSSQAPPVAATGSRR